ncbi:hypothetical protein COCON_G00171140 [Conger conger]|uniref:AF4/FMR2 C-terminal homology domain-containing protein n=1 Tax=Conger conger TaxID=82655 RepID=A0A9Q1D7Z7_CONCO|nr:hypothetical protein COCON_G00171140 [Conger conger]
MKRTMAARSSHHEDRNLQRLRERERRNQEAHQEKEFYLKITPLFGEPYKTNKGDELSSRIQRMLGNYEEVKELIGNNPHQTLFGRLKTLPPPGSYSRPGRPPHADGTQAPFQNPPPGPSQRRLRPGPEEAVGPGVRPAPARPQPVPVRPSREPRPPPGEEPGVAGHGGGGGGRRQPSPRPAHPLPADRTPVPLHSSNNSDSEPQEPDDADSPRGDGGASRPEAQDVPPLPNEGPPLPSLTFPPPLPSKPNLVMPQKPTAYVRPLDGQDQVPSESPDLKPSPEGFHGQSYESLPDLKSNNKPSLSKLKMPPQPIEALSNEAHCVEEILREMTHSWPPPLTAIHTPSTTEPSKFSFPSKETQHVHSSLSGQRCYGSSPKVPLTPGPQGSSTVQSTNAVSANSSGGESGTSSESESTSGSESDSESGGSTNAEVPPPHGNEPPPPTTDDAPTENKWHLHNWIKINQPHSNADSQVDRGPVLSPVPKQPHEEEVEASPAKNYKSQTPTLPPKFSDNEAKPVQEGLHGQLGCRKSPTRADSRAQRKTVGSKHPSKAAMAPRTEETKPGLRVESVEVAPRDADRTFTERPKVKTKPGREKAGSKTNGKKSGKRGSSGGKKAKESAPEEEPAAVAAAPSPGRVRPPPALPVSTPSGRRSPRRRGGGNPGRSRPRGRGSVARRGRGSRADPAPCSRPRPRHRSLPAPPRTPRTGRGPRRRGETAGRPPPPKPAEREKLRRRDKLSPENGQNWTKKPSLPAPIRVPEKTRYPTARGRSGRRRREKKSQPLAQDLPKAPGHKRRTAEAAEASKSRDGRQTGKHKKSSTKCPDRPKTGKKAPKGSFAFPVPAQPAEGPAPSRPLLKFEDRQYPVEYHMKEAKKLKHKADANSDKVGKAFDYLDAAMSFVESGIAMETDPQTPKSAYTMFSETMDLIRFILKLKNSIDPSSPASDKDFVVLCMRCQSLLQMAMFRYKRETALKYSRTLSEHFKNSSRSVRAPSPCVSKSTGTPSPMSPMPSPAGSASSGLGSSHGAAGGTVVIPQVVQQMASSYVNITALFLSAHDTWEQTEALAQGGSGVLPELDFALGPLSLASSMSLLVRHTRQGLHWLRLDSNVA